MVYYLPLSPCLTLCLLLLKSVGDVILNEGDWTSCTGFSCPSPTQSTSWPSSDQSSSLLPWPSSVQSYVEYGGYCTNEKTKHKMCHFQNNTFTIFSNCNFFKNPAQILAKTHKKSNNSSKQDETRTNNANLGENQEKLQKLKQKRLI